MGQSTNAILCYGFRLRDEYGDEESVELDWLPKDEDGDSVDFDDFAVGLYGVGRPVSDNYDGPEWAVYDEAKVAKLAEIGVALVEHCSGDAPMYILAARESVRTAHRGYPVELGADAITASIGWKPQLMEFCAKAGITFAEPQWILCSYWG